MTEFLACTKSPPAGVPKELGIGLCVMPRNHDGACEYDWMGGRGRVEIGHGPSPLQIVEDLEDMLRKARRMRITSTICAVLNLGFAIYWIGRLW